MRKKRGEMTVEAAFIVPIVLIILFLLIYVIFSVHDRVVILMRADMLLENETSPFMVEYTNSDEIEKGLLIYKINNFEVIENNYFFTVNIDAEAKIGLGMIDDLYKGFRHYGIHKMHRVHNYCKERRVLSIVSSDDE